MKKLTLLAAAASCAVLAGCSSLITESMGEKIMMHMAISTDLESVTHPVKLSNNEMKIFNTLLSAKNGTVIRDSRKADVKQYWEDNQAGKPLDPYDYADLTMYLATVKTVNKTKGAMRNACLSGDAAKCEQMINDNSKTITGPMAREWENLILEGGIELDERHRKTFENMGK